MKRRAADAVLAALAVVLTGCSGEVYVDPTVKAFRHLDEKVLPGLERPHWADVEVDVFAHAGSIPPFRMNAQMRGTQRSAPDQSATDLDLRSVTTTVTKPYTERKVVRTGSVRVIVLGGRTYVRNTLQSSRWRMVTAATTVVGDRRLDPAGTVTMLKTTMLAAMIRGKGPLVGTPTPTTASGLRLRRYGVTCTVDECLKEEPDLRELARKVYPGDAIINLTLSVDEQDRVRLLEVESEFPVGNEDMTQGALVKFKAKLTLHDHGKPQQITAPAL